ncbi:MAG: murein hydrolase activator EnvC family protein [Bacilli bacterium]
MMKKITKTFLIVLSIFLLIDNVDAKSLKSLKEQLAKDEANMAALIKKEKETQKKIDAANKETSSLSDDIVKFQKQIEESETKIDELNENIKSKKQEIDSLLSFLQISNGENVYLEYVFQATSFTDFIYRSSVVEQLSKYNDDLISEMHSMIEENKKLQEQLSVQIKESENSIDKLEATLKKYGLDMNDIDEEQQTIQDKIRARKIEIKGFEDTYKKNNCKEDMDIEDCLGVPYADGFTRPLNQGRITSEFGKRYHPTKHYWSNHNGIDIGGNPTGTKIFASAAGRVTSIVRKSSCGGNMVYIQHTIKGVKYRTVYMHLHSINVKVGDIVTITSVIGTVGGGESYDNCSTGAHLHFGILKGWSGYTYYNPRNYVKFPGLGSRFTTRFY